MRSQQNANQSQRVKRFIRLNLKTQVSHRMKRQLVISGVKINQESMIGLKRKGIKNGKNDEG